MCKSPFFFLQPNVWKQLSLKKLTSLSQGKLLVEWLVAFVWLWRFPWKQPERQKRQHYHIIHMPLDETAHWFVHIVQSGGVARIWWAWQRQALSSLVTLWISCCPLFVWHFKLNSDEHLLCTFPSGPSSWSKSPTTRSQMKWSIALSSTAMMLKFYGMSFLQLRKGLWRLLTTCHVTLSQWEVQNQCLLYPDEAGTTTCRFPLRSGLPVFNNELSTMISFDFR